MSTPDIWEQLAAFDRTDDLQAAIALLPALETGLATIDRESEEGAEAPFIGDLYSEVATDALADKDLALAIKLQARAAELPASEPARELGTHLAYLEIDTPGTGDEPFAAARAEAEPADEAILVSAFAEALANADAERGEALHEEALALALAIAGPDFDPTADLADDADLADAEADAEGPGHTPESETDHDDANEDDTQADAAADALSLVADVAIPRSLLRDQLGRPADAYDELAERALEEIRQLTMTADDVLAEAALGAQLFFPRDQLAAAIALWPDDAEEAGLLDDDHYTSLDELCGRMQAAAGHGITLQPLLVDVMQAHGIDLTTEPADYPEAFSDTLDAQSPAFDWPPGRNDACWCGSGKKYKRCCLS